VVVTGATPNDNGGDARVSESWSNPEIVRTLAKLTTAVDKLVDRLDHLGDEYVRKEIAELQNREFDSRISTLGLAVTDLDASVERHHRDHTTNSRSTLMAYLPPIIVAVIAAGLAALFTIATTH